MPRPNTNTLSLNLSLSISAFGLCLWSLSLFNLFYDVECFFVYLRMNISLVPSSQSSTCKMVCLNSTQAMKCHREKYSTLFFVCVERTLTTEEWKNKALNCLFLNCLFTFIRHIHTVCTDPKILGKINKLKVDDLQCNVIFWYDFNVREMCL